MKISELIQELEDLKKQHGDVKVEVQSLTHHWAPEPVVRDDGFGRKYILLNP